MNDPKHDAALHGTESEPPVFRCQDCPYETGSVDLAERHERRMEHDVWEVTR